MYSQIWHSEFNLGGSLTTAAVTITLPDALPTTQPASIRGILTIKGFNTSASRRASATATATPPPGKRMAEPNPEVEAQKRNQQEARDEGGKKHWLKNAVDPWYNRRAI